MTYSESSMLEPGVVSALENVARSTVWAGWVARSKRLAKLNLCRDYAEGRGGIPDLDQDASDELKALAALAPMNLCGMVVDAFDRGLSVVGFRSPSAIDDEPAWSMWQANRMDARQSEVHRAALVYGESYVSVLPDDDRDGAPEFATWSPLNVVAAYEDPRRSLFPNHAMLLRKTRLDGCDGWSVLMLDSNQVQPCFLPTRRGKTDTVDGVNGDDLMILGDPWMHGATYHNKPVCPVVRFVNERSADDCDPRGEVEPLINLNRTANTVNYDRLVASRFGAFQKILIFGWNGTRTDRLKLSASTVASFEDHPDDVKAQAIDGADLGPYNDLLREIKEQVALQAAIPLYAATGSISNVSTETAAMVESAHQRKLGIKRQSFGESWEQVLRLGVAMTGDEEPSDSAEVVWRETEARSFAAVVDGIAKLAQAGDIPVVELLDMVPGITQQRVDTIRNSVKRAQAIQLTNGLLNRSVSSDDDQ